MSPTKRQPTDSDRSVKPKASLDAVLDQRINERVDLALKRVVPAPAYPLTQFLRPWWAPTKSLYLAAWRELEAQGHPGVAAVGKVRGMTVEAAEYYAAHHAPKRRPAPTPPASCARSVDDEELEALGARSVGGRR